MNQLNEPSDLLFQQQSHCWAADCIHLMALEPFRAGIRDAQHGVRLGGGPEVGQKLPSKTGRFTKNKADQTRQINK
jgi:hypothetical protein